MSVFDSAQWHRDNRANAWRGMCPKAMQETDLKRLPCPTAAKLFLEWVPTGDQVGAILHGLPRSGKTRLAWEYLRQPYLSGKSILTWDSSRFGTEARAAWQEGGRQEEVLLRKLVEPDIVMIDDLGKSKLTTRVSECLFTMIDRRQLAKKLTIFTTNFTGDSFKQRFEEVDIELAEALVARWREAYFSIHVKNERAN